MTKYQFLLVLDELGLLEPLFADFDSNARYKFWMEIYAHHNANTQLCQLDLAFDLKTSHSTVQRALKFMDQPLSCQPKFWVAQS